MAHASEYLPLALERAVAAAFPGIDVPVLPVRQFGMTGQRSVTWSLARGPASARIGTGVAFVDTIDGSSPLMRTYLIEIHEPLRPGSSVPVLGVKLLAAQAVSDIERLSEAIRIEIAAATGAVAVEYDEVSDASQQRDGYLSRQIEITLPAEFLPDAP